MAHRRIYVHEDKEHNAIDLFGDTDTNNKELIEAFRKELEHDREERELMEMRREEREFDDDISYDEYRRYHSSIIPKSIELKSKRKDLIESHSKDTLHIGCGSVFTAFLIIMVGCIYDEIILSILIVILGTILPTLLIIAISNGIYKAKLALLNNEIREAERDEKK